MHIRQTENQLVITETPGCVWILASLFLLVGGAFVWGALGGFVDWHLHSPLLLAAALLMGAASVAAGVWLIGRAPVTTIVIDRIDDLVTWTQRGIFGTTEEVFCFDEIDQFRLVSDFDDEGARIWTLGLELFDGRLLTVGSLPSHFEENEQRYVFAANNFIRKQLRPMELILDDDEEER
jgi:hypothetical protein